MVLYIFAININSRKCQERLYSSDLTNSGYRISATLYTSCSRLPLCLHNAQYSNSYVYHAVCIPAFITKHVPKEIRNLLKKLLSNTQNQGSHLCKSTPHFECVGSMLPTLFPHFLRKVWEIFEIFLYTLFKRVGNLPTLSKSVGCMFPTQFLLVLQCVGNFLHFVFFSGICRKVCYTFPLFLECVFKYRDIWYTFEVPFGK